MSVTAPSVHQALKWLQENGHWNDDLVEVRPSEYGGVGVFVRPDVAEAIDLEEYDVDTDPIILLRVPKSNVLSAKNSFVYSLLEEHELSRVHEDESLEIDLRKGMHAVVLAFIYETAAGAESPWYDYLQSIKIESGPSLDNVPLCLWPDTLKNSLHNTECDLLNMTDNSEIVQFFLECIRFARSVAPLVPIPAVLDVQVSELSTTTLLTEHSPSVVQFGCHVQTVISRAFDVDDYHGLSLVPGADLFNHAFPVERNSVLVSQENVHFISSNEVCSVCGEGECDHEEGSELDDDEENESELDGEDEDKNEPENDPEIFNEDEDLIDKHSDNDLQAELEHVDGEDSTDNSDAEQATLPADDDLKNELQSGESCCDILLIKPPKNGELLNTYGNDLSNAYLLQRYGFCNPVTEPNPNNSCLLSVQMFSYLKHLKLSLKPKDRAFLDTKIAWFDEEGYSAVNEAVSAIHGDHDHEDEDCPCENAEEFSENWQLSLKVNYAGKPSPQTHAFLNLAKMSNKDFSTLERALELNNVAVFTQLLLVESDSNFKVVKDWCRERLARYKETSRGDTKQDSFIRDLIAQEKEILQRSISL